ncbi:SGNH/GDSL hydrolase family protein [Frigoribacterium sp. CG_9.8]|uniref:SGNH/GDSL hydrolase family protein n=1 Tax=Frigoribacterium sp. CG_9.8 TaxID=2787733 RepID=UPI0018CB0E7A|nr:SGNH/GDSL hydrolase family protein [Frigoribacterium sp. CG_9.8]MBG6108246.1 acyl-CoA thioesterase-1 [Frigoribacterium sp. CG_9.8]
MHRTFHTALLGTAAVIALGSIITAAGITATADPRLTAFFLWGASRPSAGSSPVAAAPVVAAPIRVLTIGDSIMNGFGLNKADAWPGLLATANGWNLTSLACDGAGFLAPGSPDECGNTFGAVIRSAAVTDSDLHPDLIIIEGSSNDFGQSDPELLAATLSALADLRSEFPDAEIIGLSTVWSESEPPSQLADINSQMQRAVTAVGGHYLDIAQPFSEQPQFLQDDDVHPTAAGQQVLATAIQTAITTDQHATDAVHK